MAQGKQGVGTSDIVHIQELIRRGISVERFRGIWQIGSSILVLVGTVFVVYLIVMFIQGRSYEQIVSNTFALVIGLIAVGGLVLN